MSSDGGEAIGFLIALAIALVIIYFIIVYVVIPILLGLAAAGLAWGGGQAVYNYIKAFGRHVKPEKAANTP